MAKKKIEYWIWKAYQGMSWPGEQHDGPFKTLSAARKEMYSWYDNDYRTFHIVKSTHEAVDSISERQKLAKQK